MKKLICHMTHIENLQHIISQGGLLCKNSLLAEHSTVSIANEDVQDKRMKVIVPISPGGTLHDYVPFYFWGATPMLLVNRPQQDDIIFLVSYTESIAEANLLLEIQKLMYFIDVLLGKELKFKFIKEKYGPYTNQINHLLQAMENHFTRGYGDRV
jgi:hypothetical protein